MYVGTVSISKFNRQILSDVIDVDTSLHLPYVKTGNGFYNDSKEFVHNEGSKNINKDVSIKLLEITANAIENLLQMKVQMNQENPCCYICLTGGTSLPTLFKQFVNTLRMIL